MELLLAAAGVACTRRIHVGPAAGVIVRVGEELGGTEIVLGNLGRSVLAETVLGSVAHEVLRLAAAPVLLVK